jgi:hypothetical protein
MIRCPECNVLLDEMNFPRVRCPECEAVIETRKKRIETGLPPPPGYQRAEDDDGGGIPMATLERGPEGMYGRWKEDEKLPVSPPRPYYPAGYGTPPEMPEGYVYPRPIRRKVNITDTLTESFELYRNNLDTFMRFWAAPAVLSIMLLLLIDWATLNSNGMEEGDFQAFVLLVIPLYIILLVVQILFSGGLIAMTLESMQKGRASMTTGYDIIRERGWKILVTSLAVSVVVTLGTFLCIIPGFLFCYWYFFAVTIVTLEGFSTSEAFARSKSFSRGSGALPFIIVLVLVVTLMNGIGEMFSMMLVFISEDFTYSGTLISGIVSWLVAPYLYITTAYFYIKGSGVFFLEDRSVPTAVQTSVEPPPEPPVRPDEH